MNKNDLLIKEIQKLKIEKNAVILSHYYQTPEVQDIADFIGDSLALAQFARNIKNDVLILAGVYFMAETAKILNPNKIVIIPDPLAGCSLADSCNAKDFKKFIDENNDAIVVSYINTTIEIKAMTDIVCTSSNAVKIIQSIPEKQKIIFAPDRNLGNYIMNITGRDMIIWDGACHVHENFSVEKILEIKNKNPEALIISHPECKNNVLNISDYIGSTSALLSFVKNSKSKKFIVVTESGIIHQMKLACPEKIFITACNDDYNTGCADCKYMKMITLEKIYNSLKTLTPEVIINKNIAKLAEKPILKMFEMS